jgi:hypothetical protein
LRRPRASRPAPPIENEIPLWARSAPDDGIAHRIERPFLDAVLKAERQELRHVMGVLTCAATALANIDTSPPLAAVEGSILAAREMIHRVIDRMTANTVRRS